MHADAHERLIVALDLPNGDAAKKLVTTLDGVVAFFKIGLELYTADGPDFVRYLTSHKKRVFLDLKFFDVPETVRRAVEVVSSLNVNFLTVHAEPQVMAAAVQGRGKSTLRILAVTVLTSLDTTDLAEPVEDLVLRRAKNAIEAGCDGVICSPREARRIRETAGDKFVIVTPGIRPAGGAQQDHKRLATPATAIEAGADYLVVGRPIRDDRNPRQKAEQIIAEIGAASIRPRS